MAANPSRRADDLLGFFAESGVGSQVQRKWKSALTWVKVFKPTLGVWSAGRDPKQTSARLLGFQLLIVHAWDSLPFAGRTVITSSSCSFCATSSASRHCDRRVAAIPLVHFDVHGPSGCLPP